MKTIHYLLTAIGFFLASLTLPESVMARSTFQFSVTGDVTTEHVRLLMSHGLDGQQINDIKKIAAASEKDIDINFEKTHNVPDFVSAKLLLPAQIKEPVEQSYYFFEQYKGLFKIEHPREELKKVRIRKNRYDQNVVKFQQYYKGIRVLDAEMVIHLAKENRFSFSQGNYVPGIDISTTPSIQVEDVVRFVESDFNNKQKKKVQYRITSHELAILNPRLSDRNLESKNILIWIVNVTQNVTGRTWTYYVDAESGLVLDVIDSARFIDSEIWDNQNSLGSADDQLWYVDNVLQTIAGASVDAETTDVNDHVTEFWNYLQNRFGVFSIDSSSAADGMQMVGHAYATGPGINCPNACWDCINDEAIFCQNMTDREVVVHEFTHGIVEHSGGGLTYRNQSGALSESFADVFGEFVDASAGVADWLHGTSRDLSNPLNRRSGGGQQNPDHTGETGNPDTDHPLYWDHCDPSIPGNCSGTVPDRGGVHHNSGVPNIVAYLLVNGTSPDDPHYNIHITALGLSKTEHLFYSTLVDWGLSSSADFLAASLVMGRVCSHFISSGQHGFTSNDCCQVTNAWKSVGVGPGCSFLPLYTGAFSPCVSSLCSDWNPYFIAGDVTIPSGSTMDVPGGKTIYLFPNAKIKALGSLKAHGASGDIRFISSRANKGLRLSREYHVSAGGEFIIPIRSFSGTDTRPNAITIRDGVEVSAFIRIDNGFIISDVNVTLNIKHTNDNDLTVTLESPSGTSVRLFSNVGGTGDNFVDTVLDDEATPQITAGTAPFTGTFQPDGSLSSFDGENSKGYWRLRVDDRAGGGTGTIELFELEFDFR